MDAKILRGPGTECDYNVKGVVYQVIGPAGDVYEYTGTGGDAVLNFPPPAKTIIIKVKE